MKSEEIHEATVTWIEKVRGACDSGVEEKARAAFASEPVMRIMMLGEIAFQLAKLRELFEKELGG